jgi:hypothetical protein
MICVTFAMYIHMPSQSISLSLSLSVHGMHTYMHTYMIVNMLIPNSTDKILSHVKFFTVALTTCAHLHPESSSLPAHLARVKTHTHTMRQVCIIEYAYIVLVSLQMFERSAYICHMHLFFHDIGVPLHTSYTRCSSRHASHDMLLTTQTECSKAS